jgi:hypothetical protein
MLEEEFEIITLIIKSWALVAHACKTLHKKKKSGGVGSWWNGSRRRFWVQTPVLPKKKKCL